MNPGVCPVCGTDLDHEEIWEAKDYIEAYCVECNAYRRKQKPRLTASRFEVDEA